ncbi:MAG: hypothetical protein K2Q09_03865, partial [Phycisphaerales bacterium]|nr:hypothetical protein [Phycisphaerales bacterium]
MVALRVSILMLGVGVVGSLWLGLGARSAPRWLSAVPLSLALACLTAAWAWCWGTVRTAAAA